MKLYGYVGLAIIAASEALLFSGNVVVGRWFTPIVWTGYILFVDAIVFKVSRRSLLTTERVELLILIVVSIGCWWIFEFYNAPRFWNSNLELWWHYHNLEPNPYLRRAGYDWAFATIFPAMFLTARLIASAVFKNLRPAKHLQLPNSILYILIVIGAAGVVVPLVVISSWFAPVIWLSFILLLDPVNYFNKHPSIIGDLRKGNYNRLIALLLSGFICGLLWEFWNYWALSKWTYTVPFFGDVKLFEMPVLGYLGFPPFAVECWVMYIFLRSCLTKPAMELGQTEIWFRN